MFQILLSTLICKTVLTFFHITEMLLLHFVGDPQATDADAARASESKLDSF
jgi:hypothetical protein